MQIKEEDKKIIRKVGYMKMLRMAKKMSKLLTSNKLCKGCRKYVTANPQIENFCGDCKPKIIKILDEGYR